MKVAEGRTSGDPETIHFGLIPRSHRGIVAINELPDLAERIQVAMLNVMEERDIQIRGYVLRLPLDVLVVASANPEDYTNRGRIITPLKDRFGAEIRTHYPLEVDDEIAVIRQEAHLVAEVPDYLVEILARFTRDLRESSAVDQRSGVSARFAIAGAETIAAAALHRAASQGEDEAVARVVDLETAVDVLGGKIEFETGEEGREREILTHLLRTRHRGDRAPALPRHRLRPARRAHRGGAMVTTGEQVTARDFLTGLPVLGESDLYDQICDRLGATNDGQRGGGHRARARGALPRPQDQQGDRRWRDGLRVRDEAWDVRVGGHRPLRPVRRSGDPLAPPVDLAEALDAIGQDVMAGYSPERAMREFLRRGGRDQTGLDDLARRVAERRRELLQRHNLDGTLQEVRELLDKAVLDERKQLARDVDLDDGDRAFREMRLENLPASTAAAVSELASYDWQSSEAREAYERIKDLLGRELLDQRFAGMKQALENATDEDRGRRQRDALRPQRPAREARRGDDTQEDFDEFMDKHGDFFPENPQNVDELLDALAQRAAAAQRMLNSMTPEQREELMAALQQAFGSPALMDQLAQLDANLQALRPGEDWSGSERFDGEEGLGLGDGTGVLQDLADLDDLADQLAQTYDGARMDDLDLDKLARQLGDEAAVDARTLQRLEQALRDSGYLKRGSDGELRLSPKAMRQLGKALLRDVAKRMSGRQGQRDLRQAGAAGERVRRHPPVGVRRHRAVGRHAHDHQRGAPDGGRGGGPPTASASTSTTSRCRDRGPHPGRVALLVDTSFSMAMDGRWVPMKRTALALHTLIRSRFRGDALQLIGFGRTPR